MGVGDVPGDVSRLVEPKTGCAAVSNAQLQPMLRH